MPLDIFRDNCYLNSIKKIKKQTSKSLKFRGFKYTVSIASHPQFPSLTQREWESLWGTSLDARLKYSNFVFSSISWSRLNKYRTEFRNSVHFSMHRKFLQFILCLFILINLRCGIRKLDLFETYILLRNNFFGSGH